MQEHLLYPGHLDHTPQFVRHAGELEVIAITELAIADDAVHMLRADNGTRWQLVFPDGVPPGLVSGMYPLP